MSALLEASGIAKSFRIPSVRRNSVRDNVLGLFQPRRVEELRVLEDVSLSVARGETVGIVGRNGSGKSTLLKILCGIYAADRGRVAVRGRLVPVLELGVGWNPDLDAIDNILLLGTVMGLSLREARGAVDEILHFAGLQRFASLELKHFSSGMAARLAYSVAFRVAGEVLVLDEIFAVGDAAFRAQCETRYRQHAAAGGSGLIVSHDPGVITSFCQRALLLDGGRIRAAGRPQEVIEAYLGLPQAAEVGL